MVLFHKNYILVFVLACGILSVSGTPPKITDFITPTLAQTPFQGEVLELECLASGNPTPTIEFRKNGTTIQLGPDPRISITGSRLRIDNVDYAVDDGIYVCVASNSEGIILSNEARIRIKVLGEFSFPNRRIDPFLTLDVTVGRPAEISCPQSSYTYPKTIFWGDLQNNAQPLIWSVSPKRYQLANGDLFYVYIEEADIVEVNDNLNGVSCLLYIEGRYQASVKTRFRRIGSLTTDFSPFLRETVFPQNQVKEGDEYSFFCSATGKPLPQVNWYKDGQLITSSTSELVISPTRNKLTVVNAKASSAGVYKCEASNRLGLVSSEGQLDIERAPVWINPIRDLQAGLGQKFKFNCTAHGIPSPTYEWFRDGVSLTNSSVNNSTQNTSFIVNGGLLTSDKLNASDAGTFQCFARNIHGTIVSTGVISIGAGFGDSFKADGEIDIGFILLLTFASLFMAFAIAYVFIILCTEYEEECL